MNDAKKITSYDFRKGCLAPILLSIATFIGIYFLLNYWSNHAISQYTKVGQFTLNAWAKHVNKLDVAFTDKGAVIWINGYHLSRGKNYSIYYYQLDIIQPNPKALVKKHYFTESYTGSDSRAIANFTSVGKYLFASNRFFPIQFRDAYTGDVAITEKAFIQKFPELKTGIGEIVEDSHNSYVITTKDGLKYHYILQYHLLFSEEAYKEAQKEAYDIPIDLSRKDRKIGYAWALSDKLRGELYLVKQYATIFQPIHAKGINDFEKKSYEKHRNQYKDLVKNYPKALEKITKAYEEQAKQTTNKSDREQTLLLKVPNKVFLDGEVLYGDSTCCILKHTSEIGKGGKMLLTAVNKDGKIIWEANNFRIFQSNSTATSYDLKTYRQKEQIAIINNQYNNWGVALLNINTGKIIWEYLPLED